MNARFRLLLLLLLIPALLVVLLVWRFSAAPTLDPEQLVKRGFWLNTEAMQVRVPPIPDHRGEQFTTESFQERWSFVFFGYTYCPDICAPTAALMRQAGASLVQQGWAEADMQMLMVSVDPARDTEQSMAGFLSRVHPSMLGLLPDPPVLQALAAIFQVGYSELKSGLIDHTGRIMLIDPSGAYRGYFRTPTTADAVVGVSQLIRELHEMPPKSVEGGI